MQRVFTPEGVTSPYWRGVTSGDPRNLAGECQLRFCRSVDRDATVFLDFFYPPYCRSGFPLIRCSWAGTIFSSTDKSMEAASFAHFVSPSCDSGHGGRCSPAKHKNGLGLLRHPIFITRKQLVMSPVQNHDEPSAARQLYDPTRL
jgi:hypothetical protein